MHHPSYLPSSYPPAGPSYAAGASSYSPSSSAMSIQGHLLEVTVVGCNKLRDTEWISRQDPYVCLEYASTKFRTRTCTDGGKNPTFQEKFVFNLIEGLREISVAVWNSNTLTFDDFIGRGKVQLHKVLSQGYDDTPWTLQSKRGKYAGEVTLIMHYPNARGQTTAGGGYVQTAPPPYFAAAPPPAAAPYGAAYAPPPAGYPPAASPSYPSHPPSYPPASAAYPPPHHQTYPPPSYPYPPPQQTYPPPQGNPPAPFPGIYPPPPY